MKNTREKLTPVFFILAVLVFWEGAVRVLQIPLYVLPSPIAVVQALISESSELCGHALVTTGEALLGIVIAFVLSLVLGTLMDSFPAIRSSLYPILVVTQTVPMIVMAPILIIYMGFGMAPKILTVVLMCFFPVAVSFADGLARVNEEYVHLVRSYGAGKWKAYWLVKIPAAIPELLSGMKVAATYSISGAVVGEWLGSQKGLGYYLLRVKNSYMLDKVFACVIFIIVLSLCMNGLTRLIAWVTMPYERKKTGVRAGK